MLHTLKHCMDLVSLVHHQIKEHRATYKEGRKWQEHMHHLLHLHHVRHTSIGNAPRAAQSYGKVWSS